jgi:hypothetical protein
MVDAFDPLCFGHTPFELCLPALPSLAITFPGDKNFDSTPTTATTCDGGDGQILMITGVPACVIAATMIATTNPTGSYGSLPLVLVATDSITIDGLLDARSATGGQPGPGSNPSACGALTASDGADDTKGGGGTGGTSIGGGGGGGGGGMIILDAPMLSIGAAAAIIANGGGGGAGGGATASGGNGGDAVAIASPAGGGIADATAGAGGNGAYETTAAARGAMGTEGGGGGGGAAGVIHVFSTQTVPAAQISPPPS